MIEAISLMPPARKDFMALFITVSHIRKVFWNNYRSISMPGTDDISLAKKAAALEALKLVENGQYVGLGTGTTAFFVIEGLAARITDGLQVKVMASSKQTAQIASDHGIDVYDQLDHLDITIDGADEVDPQWNLIKGGG